MEVYSNELVKEYVRKRFGNNATKLVCWHSGDIQIWVNGEYHMTFIDEVKRYMKG